MKSTLRQRSPSVSEIRRPAYVHTAAIGRIVSGHLRKPRHEFVRGQVARLALTMGAAPVDAVEVTHRVVRDESALQRVAEQAREDVHDGCHGARRELLRRQRVEQVA